MRILITGGAGFLGSHLSDLLLQTGHSVICVDNLITGRVENIAHLLGHDIVFRNRAVELPKSKWPGVIRD